MVAFHRLSSDSDAIHVCDNASCGLVERIIRFDSLLESAVRTSLRQNSQGIHRPDQAVLVRSEVRISMCARRPRIPYRAQKGTTRIESGAGAQQLLARLKLRT